MDKQSTITIILNKETGFVHMDCNTEDEEQAMNLLLNSYLNVAKESGLTHDCGVPECKVSEQSRRLVASIERICGSYK